jgi:hypothetical protein
MTTTCTAAAKRTPSGIFERPESALADSGLAPRYETETAVPEEAVNQEAE